MQISERTETEIKEACKLAKKTKLDILYFADSLGSMDDKDIKKITKKTKRENLCFRCRESSRKYG